MASRLLRRRGFGALWLARTVSFLGDGVTRTALVLLTARQGVTAVAVVLLASTLPRFLGPVAGALADRIDRRRLMRGCDAGQVLVLGIIAATLPPLGVLAALVAVSALLATAFAPASASCVPDLVDPAELTRGNALLGTAINVQIAAGPALGGLLVGLGSVRLAFVVDAATFAASALLLGRLPALPPVGARTAGMWTSTLAGLRYVRRVPAVRALVVGLMVFVAFAAIDNVALVFLVEDRLDGSATVYGLAQACFGIGMLAASFGLGRIRRTLPTGPALVVGAGAMAAGNVITALAPAVAVAGGGQFVGGLGNGIENIATNTHVQRLVPPPLLGRVFGIVSTGAQVGNGVAYAAGAPLVAAVGPRGAFLIAGIGSMLGLLLLLPVLREPSTVPSA